MFNCSGSLPETQESWTLWIASRITIEGNRDLICCFAVFELKARKREVKSRLLPHRAVPQKVLRILETPVRFLLQTCLSKQRSHQPGKFKNLVCVVLIV